MCKKRMLLCMSVIASLIGSVTVSATGLSENSLETPVLNQTAEDDLGQNEAEKVEDIEQESLLPQEETSFSETKSSPVMEANMGIVPRDIPGQWIEQNGRWWYRHNDGGYTTSAWEKIGGRWYYFDAQGWMATEWVKHNGKWYYCGTDGAMVIGWKEIAGVWYYFNINGVMQTGSIELGGRTQYFASGGAWLYSVSLQSWHLVDSGKHLDYKNESKYDVTGAVNMWNGYKSGVIRKVGFLNAGVDVTIYDYTKKDTNIIGETSNVRNMYLNKYVLDGVNSSWRDSIIAHEIGHALGLEHNDPNDIMYEKANGVKPLSTSDQKSYDAAYNRY